MSASVAGSVVIALFFTARRRKDQCRIMSKYGSSVRSILIAILPHADNPTRQTRHQRVVTIKYSIYLCDVGQATRDCGPASGFVAYSEEAQPGEDMAARSSTAKEKSAESRSKRRILDFDVEIGRRLRVQRMQREISQTELADALDLTFQQVQKYEAGTNRISAGKLVQIAGILKVPLAIFFEGLAEPSDEQPAQRANAAYEEIQAFAATADGRRLYRAFSQIGKPETRKLILRMMESLAEDGDD